MNASSAHPRLDRFATGAALLVGMWCVVVFFSVSQLVVSYTAAGNPPYWKNTLEFTAIQWAPWLAIGPLVALLSSRMPLRRGALTRNTAAHIAAALVVTLAIVALSFWLRAAAGSPIKRSFGTEYLRSVHSIVLVYALILGATHAGNALSRTRAHERNVLQLETQLAEARFAALQSQLQPHFLFNTLHGVSSLIHEDADAAEDMLTALSDLLRMTLERGNLREVPLRDDLGFLERYLEIHQMRLGERLVVTLSIAPDTTDLLVPSFALQPLVENAIRHSIAPRREGGRLDIRTERAGDRVRMIVSDDGPGPGASAAGLPSTGLGLANTRARLEQLYGKDHDFSMIAVPGSFAVMMSIPARAMDVAADAP